MMCFR